MNRKPIILIIALIAIAVAAYYFFINKQEEDSSTLNLYGNVDIREVQLAFNGSEHINQILVEEGESVKKGQLLAVLHSKILQAQLAEAQAQVLAQQQMVAKLKAGSRIEEVNKVKAELNAARAKAKAASSSYNRLRSLLKKKVVTADQVDQAKALRDAASAEVEAVKQALNLLEAGTRKEDVASAEAILLARVAAADLIQQRLADANLIAPSDGIIRNRILEVGSMVFPQTPVMTLAFVDPIWVRTYLPETALGKVTIGSRAKIYTDSYPNKAYDGWVGYISPTSEFTPKNIQTEELRTRLVYSMRVFACNPNNELRLGMPATVVIDTIKFKNNQPITAEKMCGTRN
jgi:HlyD family secretion protein